MKNSINYFSSGYHSLPSLLLDEWSYSFDASVQAHTGDDNSVRGQWAKYQRFPSRRCADICVHNSPRYSLIASLALIYFVCSFARFLHVSTAISLSWLVLFAHRIVLVHWQRAEDRRRQRTLFAWWVDLIFHRQLPMIELIDYGTWWICAPY